MPSPAPEEVVLLITALVNGALGHGFSLPLPAVGLGLPPGRLLLKRVGKEFFGRPCRGMGLALLAAVAGFVLGAVWQRLRLRKEAVVAP
ncbi:MAG TPA: hypothetical protein VMK65_03420 [Longimicrobiales bacterium]|nr:hypothetical protein [Longimicrobiales bacterium]